jgi:hypothetical protein
MGLGQLKDAMVGERRRRLLGEDMVAAVRRPSRALAAVSLLASCFHIFDLLLLKGKASCLNRGVFFLVSFFFRLLGDEETRTLETLMTKQLYAQSTKTTLIK